MKKMYLLPLFAMGLLSCKDEMKECDSVGIESVVGNTNSFKSTYLSEDLRWDNGQVIKYKFLNGSVCEKECVRNSMRKWMAYANLKFKEVTGNETTDVRIQFNQANNTGSGYSASGNSQMGRTYNQKVQQSTPTMNYYASNETVNKFITTTLHEVGHTVGFADEIYNSNLRLTWKKDKIINDLMSGGLSYGDASSQYDILFNSQENLYRAISISTSFDPNSIMMYNIPSTWNNEGVSYPGGKNLTRSDMRTASQMYPYKNKLPLWRHYRKDNSAVDEFSVLFRDAISNTTMAVSKCTENPFELQSLMLGYIYEDKVANSVPLYWVVNISNSAYGSTLLTTNSTEAKQMNERDWLYNGLIGYVYKTPAADRVAVYRYSKGEHNIYVTQDQLDSNTAQIKQGYVKKGLVFYIEKF